MVLVLFSDSPASLAITLVILFLLFRFALKFFILLIVFVFCTNFVLIVR